MHPTTVILHFGLFHPAQNQRVTLPNIPPVDSDDYLLFLMPGL